MCLSLGTALFRSTHAERFCSEQWRTEVTCKSAAVTLHQIRGDERPKPSTVEQRTFANHFVRADSCRSDRRRDELISLQQRIGERFAESLVGKEVDVLIDGYNDEGFLIGRTQWDAPDVDPIVFISEPTDPGVAPGEPGTMRRCVIDDNSLFDLEAHPIA